ncbi:MAG: S1 family peptidase [Acidobacteriia bacterium]|nr:S1 family peptidase [Terriglobia bacterium]
MHISDVDAVSRALDMKESARKRLMAIEGVHGTGVGCRYVQGRRTDELAITVYVFAKKPASALSSQQTVPDEIEGIKTDVIEIAVGSCCDDTARYRPLIGGSKINWTTITHPQPNSTVTQPHDGTLGCFAKSRRANKNVVLTAAHVVGGCGDPVVAVQASRRVGQPNDDDDRSCCSKCWATVFGTVVDANQSHDVAIIQIDKCVDVKAEVKDIGPITGALTTGEINGLLGQTLQMRGFRTAEVRQGVVVNVGRDGISSCRETSNGPAITVNYFHRIIVEASGAANTPIADHGDSGSPVLAAGGKIAGILTGFEGSSRQFAVVCRIDDAFNDFQANWDLEIVTSSATVAPAPAPAPAPHAFSAVDQPHVPIETLEPTEQDIQLLIGARDQVLATSMGQRLSQVISRHVVEVRALIDSRKRVAAVWQRVAGADLLKAVLSGLRCPEKPFAEFVSGMSLPERIAAMSRVLTRYGSQGLVADLKVISALAAEVTSKSYGEVVECLKDAALLEVFEADA